MSPIRPIRFFLRTAMLLILWSGCSSYQLSIQSVRYQPAGQMGRVRLLAVEAGGDLFSEKISRDMLLFLRFALEKQGLVVVDADDADLTIRVNLRLRQVSEGIDEKFSLICSIHVERGGKILSHVLGFYEGNVQPASGGILREICEGIAGEITKKADKD